MDESIIQIHNEIVKPEDIVCCLGDISFHHSLEHINRMNGTFMLVRGNHDDKHVKKVAQPNLVVVYKNIKMLCVHKPSHIFGEFKLNVVGHVHEKWIYDKEKNALNVGVDVWDFKPVSLETVLEYCR